MKHIKVKDGRLFTPIVQYRRGDSIITYFGTSHVGMRTYYEELQKGMGAVENGFYEGLKPAVDKGSIPAEKQRYIEGVERLGEAYRTLAKYLGMEFQKDVLTYSDGWKNPDMTLDEFVIASPVKLLENIAGIEAGVKAFERNYILHPEELARVIKGIFMTTAGSPLLHYIISLFRGNSPMDDGVDDEVILGERNRKLFEALEPELDEHDGLGITYGAGHLPGIDRFLRNKRFKREGMLWIPAWEIDEDMSFWEALMALER